ncbi:hypothetical protein P7K49_025350, partial [Saguinus oedipus]
MLDKKPRVRAVAEAAPFSGSPVSSWDRVHTTPPATRFASVNYISQNAIQVSSQGSPMSALVTPSVGSVFRTYSCRGALLEEV